MFVDVLRSGRSVFSLFYVSLFNSLFSLHVFFGDTEDCIGKPGEVETPNSNLYQSQFVSASSRRATLYTLSNLR